MATLEIVFSFIFGMGLLSIPILAIVLRKRPKLDVKRFEALEKRLKDLEHMNTERLLEVQSLKEEVAFFHRLVEDKTQSASKT